MSIAVYLPPSLLNLAAGQRPISTDGGTVGECLDNLIRLYPLLQPALFEKERNLKQKLGFYINTENAYPGILERVLRENDKLYIIDILAGG